jgi:hypothetical protein
MNKIPKFVGLPNVSGIVKNGTSGFSAAVAGSDFQAPISLTTTGTSGVASFSSGVLNIPNYGDSIGAAGSAGTSGSSGSTGSSGSSGTSGSNGTSGTSGSSGSTGSSGSSGSAGSSGSSGSTGTSGSSGSSGLTGSSGSSGSTGSSGTSGAGTISGGTSGYAAKFTGATTLSNSIIYDTGTAIGIGTTSPGDKLHIYSSGTGGSNIRITDAGITNADWSILGSTANTTPVFRIYNRTTTTECLNITPTGVVTAPQYNAVLNILNSQITTGSIEIQSYAVNNSWIGDNVYFNGSFITRSAGYSHQIYFGATDGIKFLTGNSSVSAGASANMTEKMRITSGGNIYVGTTSTSFAGTNAVLIRMDNSSYPYLQISASGSLSEIFYAYNSNGLIGSMGTNGTSLTFSLTTTERLRITNTGTVQPGANGTQDLGTAALRWSTVYTSDLSLSNGIGDYTIVEGENDLFLYNNKKNKVYKFLLSEVDPSEATPKKS